MIKIKDNYIAFLDLLGTKAMAVADSERYRYVIETFHDIMKRLKGKIETIEIYAFSDCAYLQESEIIKLCEFLKEMRQELIEKEICFNAAIYKGNLGAGRDMSKSKCWIMDFRKAEAVTVYKLQSCYCGAGIYLDDSVINDLRSCGTKERLFVDSIYASIEKTSGKFIYRKCKDIGFSKKSNELLQFILNLYIKTYILDKRAARYYLATYATYINGQETDSLLGDQMEAIKMIVEAANKIYDRNDKIVMGLLLINRLYEAEKNEKEADDLLELNDRLYEPLNYIYKKLKMKKIRNIREIDREIMNDSNKLLFADFSIKKHNT